MLSSLRSPFSNLEITRIGFGGEQLGLHNWGNVSLSDLEFSVNRAIDVGINYFDTADVYGLGLAEKNLSLFLGKRRKDIRIITKFGVRFRGSHKFYDNSKKWINEALELSLRRLRTDYIDFYQLHYWDQRTSFDDIHEVLLRKMEEGKILEYGFSNTSYSDLEKSIFFLKNASFCSYEFSLANDKHNNDISKMYDKMFLAYGILTGKYNEFTIYSSNDRRANSKYANFHGDKLLKNLKIVSTLKAIAETHNVTPSIVALRFVLQFFPNSSIICGMKNQSQVDENIKVFDLNLSETEMKNLISISYE